MHLRRGDEAMERFLQVKGESCTTSNGVNGECMDVSSCKKKKGVNTPGLCPGGKYKTIYVVPEVKYISFHFFKRVYCV